MQYLTLEKPGFQYTKNVETAGTEIFIVQICW